MFLYSNLVYFFYITYVQHYPKPSYIKYYKINSASHGQFSSIIKKQRLWIKFISHPAYIWILASAYLNQEEKKARQSDLS